MYLRRTISTAGFALAMLLGLPASTTGAEDLSCEPQEAGAVEVAPGIRLAWAGSYHCGNAPESGTYNLTVDVANSADSDGSLSIDGLELIRMTPRPINQGPNATATANDLPATVEAGDSTTFTISGDYELVETDEGWKANLIFRVTVSDDSGEVHHLGMNALFRGSGADFEAEDEGRPEGVPDGPPEGISENQDDENWEEDAGPPSWVEPGGPPGGVPGGQGDESGGPEPPSWVEPGGPPKWVPGPPPWADAPPY
ncbi:MAG: hypothetical protein ACOC9Y_03320 [Chloroflexota bacterium]